MPPRIHRSRRRPRQVRWALAGVVAVALGVPSGASAASFPTVSPVPAGIPDAAGGTCTSSTSNGTLDVTFQVSGITEALDDVRVSMTLAHTFSADLGAQLIAPGGAVSHTLFQRRARVSDCGSRDDFGGIYVFADDGVDGFWASTESGTYRTTSAGSAAPTNLTAAFAGLTTEQVNGTWTLRLTDYSKDDAGTLSAASLELNRVVAPVLTSTMPASAALDPTPLVVGTAPAGSTVRLYATADCSGTPLATGTAAELAAPGIEVPVPSGAATSIRATAARSGQTSPCSEPISYEALLPDAPVLSSTLPASPAVSTTPRVVGSAPEGSTVRLYETADCSGEPLATGSAAELADPGLSVTVPARSTTEVRATAELEGALSECSDPIAYTVVPEPEPEPKPDPVVPAPTPTDPGAGPLPVRPIVPDPPRCDRAEDRAIVLSTVEASGRSVRLAGLAWAPLAGRTADVRRDGRRIATVQIGADGRFAQIVAAPGDRDVADRARYRIVVGGHQSLALRAERRLQVVARANASATRVQVRGRLGAQLSGLRGLTVQRQSLCPGGTRTVRRLRTDRDGRFTVTLLRPASGQGPWIYRIRSAAPRTASVPIVVTAAAATR